MGSVRRAKANGASKKPAVKPADRDSRLGTICHDLRAPLAAVTMGATFVLQTTPETETNGRQRKILEAMLRSCAQMERLIRNFADVSSIEAGSVELRPAEHDAGEMLEIAVERARASAESHGVRLELRKPEVPVRVRCDRDRVLRAIDHLVDNAIKASPRQGTVSASASASEGAAIFEVVDRGPGIPATPPPGKKKGFGLDIARGFAEVHGGSLDVASQGGQTIARLALPLDAPHAS